MSEITVWSFFASTNSVALATPMAIILLPKWRFSNRIMAAILVLIEALLAIESLGIYHVMGITLPSIYVMGALASLTSLGILFFANSIRDGRLFFLITTVVLNTTICDIISTSVFSRDCPQWLMLYTVLFLSESSIICLYCRKPLHNMLSGNYVHWGFTSALPFFMLMALTSFQTHSMYLLGRKTPFVPSLFLCISVILVYFALYYFWTQLMSYSQIQQYNSLLEASVHFLMERQHTARAVDERIRIFRHDTRHILLLIQDRLDHNDFSGAKELLAHMQEVTDTAAFVPSNTAYTGNTMIDTILNQASRMAKEQQVEFTVKVSIPKSLPVNDVELAVVLSNALENAVRAAAQDHSGQPRLVAIQSYPCSQSLFLVISNNYQGELNLDAKTGLPVPPVPSEGHGYGTLSIYNFAQKYHCTLDCQQKDGRFYLRLLL